MMAMNNTAHYDTYDYSVFWHGREYEHAGDSMALVSLLKKIPCRETIVDVGGGLGRLIPFYINLYKKAVILEPSTVQLQKIQDEMTDKYNHLSYIAGVAQTMPFEDNTIDTILCVRVTHHIPDFAVVIKEFHRVLKPGGYVILEVANKINAKSRLRALSNTKNRKNVFSTKPVQVNSDKDATSIPFVNHHPVTMKKDLEQQGFEIISVRSVSNFRSGFLKKYIPQPVLIFFERMLQVPLATVWFGPSIYFLARKK
jgi:ubiquinone/menaquinone biosynthesis C-methylase UbiE